MSHCLQPGLSAAYQLFLVVLVDLHYIEHWFSFKLFYMWCLSFTNAVSVLHQYQGIVAHGVSDSLHQSHWWPTGQRGPTGGAKEESRYKHFCLS